MTLWRRLWRRLWRHAPRRLKVQPSGQLLLLVAVALGVAAIATNHNGLFCAWGVSLGAMVVSGFVSELSLRRLAADVTPVEGLRVGEPVRLTIHLANHARFTTAWALLGRGQLRGEKGPLERFMLPYVLKLAANSTLALAIDIWPQRRGALGVSHLSVSTSYPFGFFIKMRRLVLPEKTMWVGPRRLAVSAPSETLWASLGEFVAERSGMGDEFFALRAWRNGDDPRHIVWRRLARQKRLFVIEHQAPAAREILLVAELDRGAPEDLQEHGIAVLGGLAEVLLGRGFAVGLLCHGVYLRPSSGQRTHLGHQDGFIDALARLDPTAPLSEPPRGRQVPEAAVVGPGFVTEVFNRLPLDWTQWAVQTDRKSA